ncbi:hypothetical protein BTA51_09390 [Hahella sp. CCB-MM4]|uniref:ATP-binding protein n=1 Tax=Hahella sp. (strain CCB-MM4) TaxID=1926491 RepID=UPI000B9C19F5|nr:ATP-binding protein [Hahella sp. CCB-MM4]OZG73983.1 hypothetical protein BTA51_09390 [Hahella sp. CCB-MM4]
MEYRQIHQPFALETKYTGLPDTQQILSNELQWLQACIDYRIQLYFQGDEEDPAPFPRAPQLPERHAGEFARLLRQLNLNDEERLLFILALTPHIQPQLLDIFFTKNVLYDRIYSEFGGIAGRIHGGFIPTMETALFILAGNDLDKRLALMALFRPQHPLYQQELLLAPAGHHDEPISTALLGVPHSVIEHYLLGLREVTPGYSDFPATCLSTEKNWSDLVLTTQTANQLQELEAWLQFGEQLIRKEGQKQFKPGYRSLFYGPPGTGKTLTASLLAQKYECGVYRIDLSQLVSKYIGETEKNLEKVFREARKKNWILFFDEADSLFSKRTQINSSNDRYANQSTAYLLQRLEDCPNVVILASNLKDNFDNAFIRRFQSFVYFPLPGKHERLCLWENGLNHSSLFSPPTFSLEPLAQQFEIPGGTINNVVRYVSLMALKRESRDIHMEDLVEGVRRELAKEGKSL